MDYSYEIRDGVLHFEGLSIGNLRTGETLSWDELRRIVIVATRFGTQRPLKDRSLNELVKDVNGLIKELNQSGTKTGQEINNLKVMLAASQDYIKRQNEEIYKLKKAYNELAGAIRDPSKGA